jgi:hypothetical protein
MILLCLEDLHLQLLAERGTVLCLLIQDPFMGTYLGKNCLPTDFAPALPAQLSILTPPIARADAKPSRPTQPLLGVKDKFENLSSDTSILHSRACKACPCQCNDPLLLFLNGIAYGLPCSMQGNTTNWSVLGETMSACSTDAAAVDGAWARSRDGRAVFERLRVSAARQFHPFVMLVGATHVNVTPAAVDVHAWQRYKVKGLLHHQLSAEPDTDPHHPGACTRRAYSNRQPAHPAWIQRQDQHNLLQPAQHLAWQDHSLVQWHVPSSS